MQVIAGKYEVVKELGHGGYGKVYLVNHIDLKIPYALKLISKSLTDDAQFIERFKREAEILSRFSHPGCAQLRDFGRTDDGQHYMALEYCDGNLLESYMHDRGKLLPKEALEIICQVLEVVQAAHGHGIIHRDLKPSNIMLRGSSDGKLSVKILDFGIAKLKQEDQSDLSVTRQGMAIGTPLYMSPEQASGQQDLDHRVDIYAVGVVLYEMLRGRPPFQGSSVIQTLLQHLTQPVPPFAPEDGVSKFLQAAVFHALEKDREKRIQTAEAFLKICREAAARISSSAHAQNAPPATSEPAPKPPKVEGPKPSSAAQAKILCLDDNEMILNILRHLLERENYKVFTASNFTVIYDIIFKEKVDLMLCDVQMPGLPGTKICKMLKKTIPSLKIILFSNIPDRELEKAAKESGANDWLSKNGKPEEWMEKVKEFLGKSPA